MSTANSNVRWVRVFDRSGKLVEVPDTTIPLNPVESTQTPASSSRQQK